MILQLQEKYREAIGYFNKSLALKPDFAMAHRNLGFCYFQLREYEDATVALRQAVVSQPDLFDGWAMLGKASDKRGAIEEARKAFQQALTLQPNNQEIQERLRQLDIPVDLDPSDLTP